MRDHCLKQHAYCIVSCFSYQNFAHIKKWHLRALFTSFSDQKSRWPTEFLKNGRKFCHKSSWQWWRFDIYIFFSFVTYYMYIFKIHVTSVIIGCWSKLRKHCKYLTSGTENSTYVVGLLNWWWCHILEYHRYQKEWRIANVHALTKLLYIFFIKLFVCRVICKTKYLRSTLVTKDLDLTFSLTASKLVT